MRQLLHQRRILNLKLSCSSLSVILLSAPGRLQPRAGCSLGVVRVACLGGRIRGYDVGYRVKCTTWRIKCRFPDASRRWRSATCFPASSTDRAAISTIAPRTHTDRRDAESGRCNRLNRPSRPRASSSLTHSFMATSIHADTSWQPPPTAQSGPRHSTSGSRRRALSIRRDQQCNRPPGPTSPLEVNVTMPQKLMPWTPK
jgi:hypothetical protein